MEVSGLPYILTQPKARQTTEPKLEACSSSRFMPMTLSHQTDIHEHSGVISYSLTIQSGYRASGSDGLSLGQLSQTCDSGQYM